MAIHYIDAIVKKYTKDMANSLSPFEERLKSLEDFHNPKKHNQEKIHEEISEEIFGNPAAGTHGIRGEHYKEIERLFDYNKGTREAGKEKLSKEETEKFLDKHVYDFVKVIAKDDLEELKKGFGDDKEGFKKALESLYKELVGMERQDIRDLVKEFDGLDYRTFKRKYDALLNQQTVGVASRAIGYITGNLIQPYDRIKLGKKVKELTEKHPTHETIEHPFIQPAAINVQAYLGLKYPKTLPKKEDLKKINLKEKVESSEEEKENKK